ncbi:hypothetical protein CPC08DRAFT_673231, partial [Agrocybe pediades]
MFKFLSRSIPPLRTQASRRFNHSHKSLVEIEQINCRLLDVVRNRVDERKTLLEKISQDTSTLDDKVILRRFKELEPIEAAWNRWTSTRQ